MKAPSPRCLLLTLVFTGTVITTKCWCQSAQEITRNMFAKARQIKSLTYTMCKKERIDGKLKEQTASVKLLRHPFKVYTRQSSPKDGLEVLYIGGENTALINPNGFPWFNLRLSPKGSVMRKNQHHTILEAGYDHFVIIMEHLFEKYEDSLDDMTKYLNSDKPKDPCWTIEFTNHYYKLRKYIVKENETLLTIANKFKVSAYKIKELNDDVDYEDINVGQTLVIPNDYSPKMILSIDKTLCLPTLLQVYDDHGLFEQYQFSNIEVNPKFEPEEFTSEYEPYEF